MSATLDTIGDLQQQICGLQAEQVRQVAAFVDQRNALDADLGVPDSPGRYRSLIAEVSIACNVSTLTAQSFVADAYNLATKHPYTLAGLGAGTLNLSTARAVARETQLLADPTQQGLADQVIAEEAADVPPGKIRGLVERRVIEIDPALPISPPTCPPSKPSPAGTPWMTTPRRCAPPATPGRSAT